MFKLIKSNIREILTILAILAALIGGMILLGNAEIASNGTASTALSIAVSLIGGIMKFVVCLGLAWFGLAVTFPEANKFVVGNCFDNFWQHCTNSQKGLIALAGVAVLALVAALCMAS